MSLVKSLAVSTFLGLGAATVMIPPAPAFAATVAEVQALLNVRIAQLTAEAAALKLIIDNGSTPPTVGIQAQADRQLLLARIAQLNAVGPQLAGLPGAVIDGIAAFIQAEISAA